ncbi:phosphotransferase [Thiomicrorhabdus sp.]|uniref:phosphotransferase n=1 Tax=Thiomicrorhabdus sp. TaxID=2039724 RepID=UPI0029C67CC7|nr:phosphotransferase [Thiomicrorhabdus sp.]
MFLLDEAPLIVNDGLCLLRFDYLPGRFCEAGVEDMRLLGHSIARMHLALEHYPHREQVKAAGLKRHERLKQRFSEIRKSLTKLPVEVAGILDNYPPDDLELLIEEAQMVHGDLNMGNVWFNGEECVFLDLEESLSAWFTPMKDLAFVLERFVLTHPECRHEDLGCAFLRAYYRQHHGRFNHPEHLGRLLQALAIRALLILSEISESKGVPMSNEWKKFVYLFKLAHNQSELLQRILWRAAQSPQDLRSDC